MLTRNGLMAVGFVTISGATAAYAQGTTGLEEVIVTAQKREQSIQDVGIAINVLSGDDLIARGVTDLQSLPSQTPGLTMERPGTPANTTLTLRGVGLRDIGPNAEGAVAVYRDGAYASFLPTISMPMFDIDRVEVLKGPQGTLFGRNATGGLLHIVSNAPTSTSEGYVRASYGEFGQAGVEGALNQPLTDELSSRFSWYGNRNDGWVENTAGKDGNSMENYAGRLQLLYQPTDNVKALLLGYFNSVTGRSAATAQSPLVIDPATGSEVVPTSAAQYSDYCNAAFSNFGLAGLMGYSLAPPGSERDGNCFAASGSDPYKRAFDSEPYRVQNYGFTGTAEVELSFGTLTSITDYQGMQQALAIDADGSTLPLFTFGQVTDGHQLSQELRLSGGSDRTRWVTGAYFLNISSAGTSFTDLTGAPTILADLSTSFDQHTDSIALFAQGEYDFAERWTALAGARWTRDRKDITVDHTCVGNSTFGFVPTGPTTFQPICEYLGAGPFAGALQFSPPVDLDSNKSDWSGKVQVEFRPADDVLTYLGVSRGIKSGGFNVTAPQFYTADDLQFDQETLTSVEAGFKSTIAGGTTRINGSAFYYDYKDFQSFLIVDGFLRTINVDSKVKGAELELQTAPTDNWFFQMNGVHLDSHSDVPLPSGAGEGRFVNPNTPRWSFSALARYQWTTAGGSGLNVQLSGTHVGERTTNAVDVPSLRIDAYERFDARAGYTSPDQRWDVAVFVNNFTDEEILTQVTSVATLLGSASIIYDQPRIWGITAGYRW